MISRKDSISQIVAEYPEVSPILAQAGLHCVGCHISEYETLEQGCAAHGMSDEDIDYVVDEANKAVKEQEKLPPVSFDTLALQEMEKRVVKAKTTFLKIVPLFAGEFDFSAVTKKEAGDMEIPTTSKKLKVLVDPKIERVLRGILVSYSAEQKDFIAKRMSQEK